MNEHSIRLATIDDAEAILAIYTPYVVNTVITFEYDVPSIVEFRERIRNTQKEYPYIVYVSDGRIVGYAYAHRQRERAAYQWNAELSVYMDGDSRGRGFGKTLYACLMELLKLQHIINVYGAVTVPNAASEKLHESFGFRRLGDFVNTGYKMGQWLNVAWFEKAIAEFPATPKSLLPFPQVDKTAVERILVYFSEHA
jgi:L-amino acid N-acyltransferase YncA